MGLVPQRQPQKLFYKKTILKTEMFKNTYFK